MSSFDPVPCEQPGIELAIQPKPKRRLLTGQGLPSSSDDTPECGLSTRALVARPPVFGPGMPTVADCRILTGAWSRMRYKDRP